MIESREPIFEKTGGTSMGRDADIRVTGLSDDLLEEAAGVLARSFRENPNFVDLFPNEKVRVRVLPRLQRACLRDAMKFGRVHVASRGGKLVGVAAWLPSGAFPLSPWRQLRVMPDMVRILAAAPQSVPRLARFMSSVAGLHPAQP